MKTERKEAHRILCEEHGMDPQQIEHVFRCIRLAHHMGRKSGIFWTLVAVAIIALLWNLIT